MSGAALAVLVFSYPNPWALFKKSNFPLDPPGVGPIELADYGGRCEDKIF